jgi:hypothetical protein
VVFTALIFAVQLVGILITAQIPAIRDFYPYFHPARQGGAVFWGFEVVAFLSMASWEFINHGYLTLGLKERLGLLSVLVGAIPFGILHFGKPTLEIYYSVADGMGLALLAYACGSIWPGVWLHGVGRIPVGCDLGLHLAHSATPSLTGWRARQGCSPAFGAEKGQADPLPELF